METQKITWQICWEKHLIFITKINCIKFIFKFKKYYIVPKVCSILGNLSINQVLYGNSFQFLNFFSNLIAWDDAFLFFDSLFFINPIPYIFGSITMPSNIVAFRNGNIRRDMDHFLIFSRVMTFEWTIPLSMECKQVG